MALRVVTPPAEPPVSLTEAKAHLRLEESVDDTYVSSSIEAARLFVEGEIERGLVMRTVELSTAPPASSCEPVPLPGGTLADSPAPAVKYLDSVGALITLDPAAYFVVSLGDAKPGELRLLTGGSWPEMYDRPDALRVQYRVGWANAAAVPAPLKHAVLLVISQLYEIRPVEITGTIVQKSFALDALMAPYRFRSI